MLKKVFAENLQLAYREYGSGPTTVLALHGHSKSPKDFESFGNEGVRVLALSLFHHGDSRFPTKRINRNPLTPEEFKLLVENLIKKEKVEKFHLVAYSQGGRFALKILECCPERLESISLLSPDGIDIHGFYDRSSRKPFFLRLMRLFEQRPKALYTIVRTASFFGAANPKVVELTRNFTDSKEKMQMASRTWRNFRAIRTLPQDAGKIVKDKNLHFQIIMGAYDHIFPPKMAMRFVKEAGLPPESVKIIQSGHDFFKNEPLEQVKKHMPFLSGKAS